MDTFITQLLLCGVIFVELVIYWSLPKPKRKYKKQKRQYRHTESYFAKKFK